MLTHSAGEKARTAWGGSTSSSNRWFVWRPYDRLLRMDRKVLKMKIRKNARRVSRLYIGVAMGRRVYEGGDALGRMGRMRKRVDWNMLATRKIQVCVGSTVAHDPNEHVKGGQKVLWAAIHGRHGVTGAPQARYIASTDLQVGLNQPA